MVTLAHSPDGPGSFPVPSSQLPLSVWCLIPEMLPGEGLLKGMGPPWATLSHSFGIARLFFAVLHLGSIWCPGHS